MEKEMAYAEDSHNDVYRYNYNNLFGHGDKLY
jgi:hypothetical protein